MYPGNVLEYLVLKKLEYSQVFSGYLEYEPKNSGGAHA